MTSYAFKCATCGARFSSFDGNIHEIHKKQCPKMKIVSVKKAEEED